VIGIWRAIGRLFRPERMEVAPGPLADAADALDEVRGDNVSPASGGDHGPDPMQNIANAGRDAGMYNMLDGTDIVGKSADGYRNSK
jgi:hypothetical protein